MADFTSFNNYNDTYSANVNRKEMPNLPPGSYTLDYDQQTGTLYFKKFDPNYDAIIDLPSPEYDEVMKEVDMFLSDECRADFETYSFLYKRSFLLYGKYGTGKTCIVNRVGQKVVQKDGVILFNPHPELLKLAFKVLEDIQPNRTTMVIFEEFEELLARHEDAMLSLMDGEIQKNNVMYLATTNHIDQVPARLKRPGRFATVLEVKYPNAEAREVYLSMKLKAADADQIPGWVKATDGLSIDELKETVLSVKCLRKPLEQVVAKILETRENAESIDESYNGMGQSYGEYGPNLVAQALQKMQGIQNRSSKKRG